MTVPSSCFRQRVRLSQRSLNPWILRFWILDLVLLDSHSETMGIEIRTRRGKSLGENVVTKIWNWIESWTVYTTPYTKIAVFILTPTRPRTLISSAWTRNPRNTCPSFCHSDGEPQPNAAYSCQELQYPLPYKSPLLPHRNVDKGPACMVDML